MCGRPFLGTVTTATYDGTTDDLLTAGLGWDGLQSATAPALSATPTAASCAGVLSTGTIARSSTSQPPAATACCMAPTFHSMAVRRTPTPGAGKIAGTEYLAYSVDANGRAAATLMVQIPSTFNQSAALRRDRDVVRFARRLRCRIGGWRMGIEARLRSRLHRQGHRQWRARTRHQHDHVDQRADSKCNDRRQCQPLHGRDHGCASGLRLSRQIRSAMRSSTRIRKPIRKRTGACSRGRRSSLRCGQSTSSSRHGSRNDYQAAHVHRLQHIGHRRVGVQRRRAVRFQRPKGTQPD